MPVVMQMHWPEITIELYEQARERIGWERDVPAGAISHVAWMADDGFHVVDVWESAEEFERFGHERLMPVVAGELGVTSEPVITVTPAHAAFAPYARNEREAYTAASTASS
jgi:hypothetical protein